MDESEQQTVTEAALLSVVDVARADAKLALLHARRVAVRSVSTLCLGLLTGFSLQAGVLLAVLVPSIRSSLAEGGIALLVGGAFLVTVVLGALTYRSARRLLRLAETGTAEREQAPDSSLARNAQEVAP